VLIHGKVGGKTECEIYKIYWLQTTTYALDNTAQYKEREKEREKRNEPKGKSECTTMR